MCSNSAKNKKKTSSISEKMKNKKQFFCGLMHFYNSFENGRQIRWRSMNNWPTYYASLKRCTSHLIANADCPNSCNTMSKEVVTFSRLNEKPFLIVSLWTFYFLAFTLIAFSSSLLLLFLRPFGLFTFVSCPFVLSSCFIWFGII